MRISKCRLIALFVCLCAVFTAVNVAAENVVNLPYFRDIPSFVPYYWQAQHILAQGTLFEGLFGYAPDPNGLGGVKLVPVIADKWKISPDGTVWTITLRKDKKWSNGDPINAKDFEWTYKYMCDPSIPDVPLWANHLQHVKNGWAAKAGGVPMENLGVKTTDDYTIVFTLAYPRFDFNCWLAVGGSMPLHRKTVEKFGNDWWKPENFVGNGPYVPTKWVANKEVEFVKNKNYVGTRGNVDRFVLKCFADDANEIQPYQAGELDMAWVRTVADYKYVQANANLKAVFSETPMDLFWSGIQVTRGFNEIFDNKKVRQAFAMSIDRETLCRTVLGNRAMPLASYWTKNDLIGKKLKEIPYDPAAAKKLLAEAGYPDGKGLPQLYFFMTQPMPEAEFIVDQWKKNLGVNVLIENLESGVYWSQYVWANWTPDAKPGYTRINAPMNSFGTDTMDKNAGHTWFVYDFPVAVKKKTYDLEQLRIGALTKESGTKQADWDTLAALKDQLVKGDSEIKKKEPSKLWLADMTSSNPLDAQFAEQYDKYKAAKSDQEKIDAWRLAYRLLLENQKFQNDYNGMYETNKQARRLKYDLFVMPFDKALDNAAPFLQILQDQYFMVPLYMEKAQYVVKKNITGLMIYKFSWGPAVFNLQYVNVK